MELIEAIRQRHSVRRYTDQPIAADAVEALNMLIGTCNGRGGLHIQLVLDEPKAFGSRLVHYGKFAGVVNYVALIGPAGPTLDERCGYYGECIVLRAQQLGLNTCWVGQTYSKVPGAFAVGRGEKLVAVVAIGYGRTQGAVRSSKPIEKVAKLHGGEPAWFLRGVEAALLAPTAMNQQRFVFEYLDGRVAARAKWGFYTDVDLGIAKYHFEIGADPERVLWA